MEMKLEEKNRKVSSHWLPHHPILQDQDEKGTDGQALRERRNGAPGSSGFSYSF